MSKRRTKRPSPDSQSGKPSMVDPVSQMPGMMGRPPRGKGFIPLSGGPKVKKGDTVGPPEDLIRRVNRPKTVDGDPNSQTIIPTVSPRKKGEGQPKPRQRIKGDYSNPADFVKPSDLLTPIEWPGRLTLPKPSEDGFGPTDEPYGPIDTRPKPKPVKGGEIEIVVTGEPFPPEDEMNDNTTGVYYFDKGRFLTRGKYNAKTSRTTQRRG